MPFLSYPDDPGEPGGVLSTFSVKENPWTLTSASFTPKRKRARLPKVYTRHRFPAGQATAFPTCRNSVFPLLPGSFCPAGTLFVPAHTVSFM